MILNTNEKFNPDINDKVIILENELINSLIDHIKNRTLTIYGQKIYNLEKNSFDRIEILTRLFLDDKLIPPFMYFKYIELLGLQEDFDLAVIEQSLNIINFLNNISNGIVYSINVHEKTMIRSLHKIIKLIKEIGTDTSKFKFDIIEVDYCLECAKKDDYCNKDCFKTLKHGVKKLSEMGVGFYLDDFPTGKNNIKYVSKLVGVNTIKFDGQRLSMFYETIYNTNENHNEVFILEIQKILQSLLKINPNFDFVFEKIETFEWFELLKKIGGINGFQGYFLHKPEPIETIDLSSKRNLNVMHKSKLQYIPVLVIRSIDKVINKKDNNNNADNTNNIDDTDKKVNK